MALKVGFSAYKLEIKEKRAQEAWRFRMGGPEDGFGVIALYLASRLDQVHRLGTPDGRGNYVDQRAIHVKKVSSNREGRYHEGMIEKGEAGQMPLAIRNLNEPDAGAGVKYTTERDDGVMYPLYFRVYCRDGDRFGVALLQTLGVEGMKGYLETDLRTELGKGDHKRTVKLTQIVDIKMLEKFARDGSLQDVVIVNSGKRAASVRKLEQHAIGDVAMGEGDKLSLKLHKRGGWGAPVLRALVQCIRREQDPTELFDVPNMQGAIDDVQIEIQQGGRKQVFSLMNPDDSPVRYDVSNHVRAGEDGRPTWRSLQAAADSVGESVFAMVDGR